MLSRVQTQNASMFPASSQRLQQTIVELDHARAASLPSWLN
jgi:hypothetical protein